ncbi:FCD domain-containing protein [Thalassospira xiamenensis]|uniref:GntR family transcriptional regulator n=1 Tax=Thalassospira xiamenensis TaxID=220697 RepID=A0ABR5Y5E9_9PROT|nr:FCD domain-containing protein [Thalassospira xiamenensis]KZD06163.1 GntR family transcriptional regulator [Thalassospira xiamenensis]KZD07548.1 GntR family transcriptional regulator [Thalassospira xiamenensis]
METTDISDPNDVDQKTTSSLTAHLECELEHLILTGEVGPGERLNEIHLSSKFGTSRGPLREAMRGLAARGLVSIVRNRGMYVRSISTEEALQIYDVRAAIFGLAGRLLTEKVTDQMLDELAAHLNTMDSYAASRDFEAYYHTNLKFHDYLMKATDNNVLILEYKSLVDKLHLCRAKGLVQSGNMIVSNREHREMIDSIASGDKYRSQEAFFRHVERAKSRFLAALSSTADID